MQGVAEAQLANAEFKFEVEITDIVDFKIMESRGRLMVLSALQQVDRSGDEEPAAKRSKIKMQSLRDEEENRQGDFSIQELKKGRGCSVWKSMNKTDKPNSMKITLKKIDNMENQRAYYNRSSDDDSSSSEDIGDTDQDPDFEISSEDRHKYRYNKKNKNVWMTRLESESSESVHTTEECDRQSICGQKKKRMLKKKLQTKDCSSESEEGNGKKEEKD
ncbi:hypothetical protein J6590_058269 [Homalodisca vitripennis]|nr:hypothetical protein J6590_058269 [Homalodisca vitripennis]